MALSRTARILIAVLLLAAAGFFWVNYFQQNPTATLANGAPTVATPPVPGGPGTGAPTPLAGANGNAVDGIVTAPAEAEAGQGVATTGPDGAAGAPTTTTPGAAPSAAPVVVTDPPAVVLRDLVVEELPFLVTEPPVLVQQDADAERASGGRAVNAARANVNPFSPILVQAASQPTPAPVAAAPASQEPQVVVVGTGAQPGTATAPTTARTPVPAPAPRAVAPAPVRAAELPRPLPSGTLTAVPDILRDSRSQPRAASGPADLGTVAAVVVPGESEGAELPFASRGGDVAAATSPDVIGTGHSAPRPAATNGNGGLPLAVGADPLSRYLRDNNVRFTGQVLGPLAVGVFRSNTYQQPVVVTLGQTLPETEILLADLRGYEAKFSLGDYDQVLSLDSRR